MKKLILMIVILAAQAWPQVSVSGTVSVSGSVSLAPVSAGGGGGGGSCGGTYDVAIPLVLDKAASVDLADFAYPFTISYKGLATLANGGKIQHTVTDARGRTRPADAKICTAQTGGSALKFYMPEWDSTTGNNTQIVLLAAPLHVLSNDVVWLLVGSSSATADPYDYSLITDAGIADWCHGESFNCDVNNGTSSGSSPTANVAGRVGGALSLTSANGDYVTLASPAWPGGNNITVMGWLDTSGGGFMRILSNLNSSGQNGWLFSLTNVNGPMLYEDSAGSVHQYQEPCCTAAEWFSQAFTSNGSTIKGYVMGNLVGSGTGGAIGSPSQNMLIGNNADGTGTKWNGLLDELLWAASEWPGDKVKTLAEIQRLSGYSAIYDVTGADPAIRQRKACAPNLLTEAAVCKMDTTLTSASNHYVATVSAQEDGTTCSTAPVSSCGFTYTRADVGHFTGTLHNYYACAYTAPITSSCNETLTWPVGNTSAWAYEVWNVTTTGMTTANAGNSANPPNAMSANCAGTKCLLLCGTKGNLSSTATSNSEGYDGVFAPTPFNIDHPAQAYAATGVVTSGTKSCTLSGSFTDTGVMILMPKN